MLEGSSFSTVVDGYEAKIGSGPIVLAGSPELGFTLRLDAVVAYWASHSGRAVGAVVVPGAAVDGGAVEAGAPHSTGLKKKDPVLPTSRTWSSVSVGLTTTIVPRSVDTVLSVSPRARRRDAIAAAASSRSVGDRGRAGAKTARSPPAGPTRPGWVPGAGGAHCAARRRGRGRPPRSRRARRDRPPSSVDAGAAATPERCATARRRRGA